MENMSLQGLIAYKHVQREQSRSHSSVDTKYKAIAEPRHVGGRNLISNRGAERVRGHRVADL